FFGGDLVVEIEPGKDVIVVDDLADARRSRQLCGRIRVPRLVSKSGSWQEQRRKKERGPSESRGRVPEREHPYLIILAYGVLVSWDRTSSVLLPTDRLHIVDCNAEPKRGHVRALDGDRAVEDQLLGIDLGELTLAHVERIRLLAV